MFFVSSGIVLGSQEAEDKFVRVLAKTTDLTYAVRGDQNTFAGNRLELFTVERLAVRPGFHRLFAVSTRHDRSR